MSMYNPRNLILAALTLFASTLLINSCANREVTQTHLNPDKVFRLKDTLRAEVMPEEIWGRLINQIFYTEEGIICCTNIDDYIVQLINPETGALLSATGKKGRGPGEFLGAMPKHIDRTLKRVYIFNSQKKSLVPFNYSDKKIEQLPALDYFYENYSGFVKIDDTRWVVLEDSQNSYLKLVDTLGNVLDSLPNAALSEDVRDVRFNTVMKGSPDKGGVILYEMDLPIFRKYSVKDDKLVLDYRIEYLEPVYQLQDGMCVIDLEKKSSILGNYLTEKYHYMIHPGLSSAGFNPHSGEQISLDHVYILVYDMDGNFMKSLLFDRFFRAIAVSDDDKYLYAVDNNMSLVRYELPTID